MSVRSDQSRAAELSAGDARGSAEFKWSINRKLHHGGLPRYSSNKGILRLSIDQRSLARISATQFLVPKRTIMTLPSTAAQLVFLRRGWGSPKPPRG